MSELSRQQRAAITKRNTTRNALLDAADSVFTDADYSAIKVEHVANHAGVSTATYYTVFPGKSAWGAAVLDRRLSDALDQQAAPGTEQPWSPRARLAGFLSLLGEVSTSLPGITKALVDERTDAQRQYADLLPRFYKEVTHAVMDGQRQDDFSVELPPSALADFVLDSLALAYAVHMDNPDARAMSMSLALAGVQATE